MNKLKLVKEMEMKIENEENIGLVWKTGVNGSKIWMGHLHINSVSQSKAQHHNESEVALYLFEGEVTIFHGNELKDSSTIQKGDFVYVPPFTAYALKSEGGKAKFISSMADKFSIEILEDSKKLSKSAEEVKLIKADKLDDSTDQTSNMPRKTGIQSSKLWIGRVTGEPAKDSGAHHHGEADTGGFIISGTTRILFGDNYDEYYDFHPGDYVHVPPLLPHIERNMSQDTPVEFVTTRNPRNIVVNI